MTYARGWLMNPTNLGRAIITIAGLTALSIVLTVVVGLNQLRHDQQQQQLAERVAAQTAAVAATHAADCTFFQFTAGYPGDPAASTARGKLNISRAKVALKQANCPTIPKPEVTK